MTGGLSNQELVISKKPSLDLCVLIKPLSLLQFLSLSHIHARLFSLSHTHTSIVLDISLHLFSQSHTHIDSPSCWENMSQISRQNQTKLTQNPLEKIWVNSKLTRRRGCEYTYTHTNHSHTYAHTHKLLSHTCTHTKATHTHTNHSHTHACLIGNFKKVWCMLYEGACIQCVLWVYIIVCI